MAFPPVVGVAGITKSWTRTRCGDFAGRYVRPAFLKVPINSFFFVLSKYFDSTNYDPVPIMDTVFGAGGNPSRAVRPTAAHLIRQLYT